MNRLFVNLTLVILLASLNVFSQNQPSVTDKTDEYYKIFSAAYEKLSSSPYRVKSEQIIKVKDVKDDFVTVTITSITEFVAPDKQRRLDTTVYTYSKAVKLTDTIGFPYDTRIETITIGNLKFIKEENRNWKKIENIEKKETAEESKETKERDYIIEFLGRKSVNGKEFDIYQLIKTKDISQPKARYWINVTTGLPAKIEFDLAETKDTTNKTEVTYEQDANIKIEAPKID